MEKITAISSVADTMVGRAFLPAGYSRALRSAPQDLRLQAGYTLAGVLVLIAILSIFMAMAVPMWDRIKQRENEEELIFRGTEYVEAIGRYHRKFNSFPPDIKTLYEMKFLRHLYKDPMTESGEWKVLHPDSLVQTGAAGEINQPGAQNPADQNKDNQNKDNQDNNKQDQSNQNPKSPGMNDTSQKTKDLDQVQSDKNGDEDETSEEQKVESIGPVVGVVSRSKKNSLRIYNGQSTYNKWVFVYAPQQQQPAPNPGADKGGKTPKPGVKPPTTPGGNNPNPNPNPNPNQNN